MIAEVARRGDAQAVFTIAVRPVETEPFEQALLLAQVELVGELGAVAVVEDWFLEDLRIDAADKGPEEVGIGAAVGEAFVDVDVHRSADAVELADELTAVIVLIFAAPRGVQVEALARGAKNALVQTDVGDRGVLYLVTGCGQIDFGPVVERLVGGTRHAVERAGGDFSARRKHALRRREPERRIERIRCLRDQLDFTVIDKCQNAGVPKAVGEAELGEGCGIRGDEFLAVERRRERERIPRGAAAGFPE